MSGDVNGVKDNATQIQTAAHDAASAIGDALGILSNISGVIGGPGAVLGLLQLLVPKTDPVIAKLKELQALMDAALHFEVVNDAEEHQFHIKDVMRPTEDSWGTLKEVNFDTHNPLITVDTLQHDTFDSMNALRDPIYWHRPYYDQLDYNDGGGWFHHVIPPDIVSRLGPSFTEVFDYRLVLPSFLFAIQIRSAAITTLHQLRPEIMTDEIFRRVQQEELQPTVTTLSANYEQIVAGFVASRMPDANSRLDLNAWDHAGHVIGVVDSYVGTGLIDGGMFANFSDDDSGFPVWNDDFDKTVFPVRYQLGVLARWKTLYLTSGLHGTWASLQAFRKLAGQNDAEPFDTRASWSLKEIHNALGSALRDVPPPANAPISASETLRRLYGVTRLPLFDPNSFWPNGLSLRRGLSAVIDGTSGFPLH
jgi:hypothetical protein